MAKSLLTQVLDAVSGGAYSDPNQAGFQPVSPSEKTLQVTEASNRITNNFASKGQFPTLTGEIARFDDQAQMRAATQNEVAKEANDHFGSTQELTSGSTWNRVTGNIKNDLASVAASLANIGLQIAQTPLLSQQLGLMANRSDAEIQAFNRETKANQQREKGAINTNALLAQDLLGITPGANQKQINSIAKAMESIPAQSAEDAALLNAPVQSISNTDLGIPQIAGMPVRIGQNKTVRDNLQEAQNLQNSISKALGNRMQGRDNVLGTESWVNRKPQQDVAAQLAEENKDESLLGAIGNTVGEYLSNPGLVIQAASESLPYALGVPGIMAGTLGQFTQNQSDANTTRGNGGLPTQQDVEESLAWNALDSGLNFAENLVNARALGGLSNSIINAPVRQLSKSVANTALGRAGSNLLSRTGLSGIANATGRVIGARPVTELATAMGVNALTGAAQNQIETRNLLGDDRVDREGNINAGVLGALSAGALVGPSVVGSGIRSGITSAGESITARQNANNPIGAEQRQAAQESSKPFEDLTNPDHEDFNPQAAVRQQISIYADRNASPEMKQEAVNRAQSVRDTAEQSLVSVREEIASIQNDNQVRQALTDTLTQADAYPDSPQKQALVENINQRIAALDERQLTPEQQQDLVTRYETASANAERVRSTYDQFAKAAKLDERVSPQEIKDNLETVSDPDAPQNVVNEASDHVISHPMQYTPEQLRNLADDTSNRFNDDQRSAIRALADARVAQNELKTNLSVNEDIFTGSKGYRSLGDYTSDYARAIREGNTSTASNLASGIDRFLQSHQQKAELARQVFESGQRGQIIRENGQWAINTGTPLKGTQKASNGALDIYPSRGSKPGSQNLVNNIESEVAAIQATRNAMQAMNAARPVANADATQQSSQPVTEAQDVTTNAEAKPEREVVESVAEEATTPKQKNIDRPNRRTSDDLKTRTAKQQERIVPAEQQSKTEQPTQTIDNETETPISNTSETDNDVGVSPTIAVKSDENTKAEGAVTVLKPEGKSLDVARTEELAKPFADQNLVLTGFVQKVREGFVNPLVTVPDFMSRVLDKATWSERFTEVNRYLAKQMNDTQKNFIGMYTQFHKKISNDLDSSIFLKKAEYKYQDYIQFLLNPEGKLDENVKTAMTASMFSWLAENGNKLVASKQDIAKLFNIDNEDQVTTATYNQFAELGSSQRAVVQSLGQRAYQMLGFKVLNNVDPAREGKMQQALGMYAMHTLMSRGYLEQTTMTSQEYFNHMTDGLDPEATQAKLQDFVTNTLNGIPLKDAKLTYNFVRVPRKEMDGNIVPTDVISRIVDGAKQTSGIINKLFGFDGSVINPLTEKPGKFIQKSVGDFNQEVSSELVTRLTKMQQEPYRINESVNSVVNKLASVDNSALMHMLGVRTEAETPFVHSRDRMGQKAKNDDILRAVANAQEFISGLTSDDSGRLNAIYMPLSVWSNNRVGITSNTLNPQGNKVHRILVGMQAHETTIPTNQSPIDSNGVITDYGRFLLTVAQGMEGAPIRTSDGSGMPTVDKVTGSTYLKGMEQYLNTESVQKGIQSMLNIIESEAPKATDIERVKNLVAEFDMGPQSLSALHSLALHAQAVRDGKPDLSVAIGGESDGVTNGPILTNVMYATGDYDLLARGGMFTADSTATNVPQFKEQGGKDYYELLGNAQNTFWNSYYPKVEGKITDLNQAMRRAMDYLSPGFGTRKKAKVLATPFNYGSGIDSLQRASARDMIDNIYGHMSAIAEANTRSKEEGEQYKATVEKAINILLAFGKENKISVPKFSGLGKTEDILNYTLPKNVEKALMDVEIMTRGDASQAAIEQVAAPYIQTRDLNTAITNAAYEASKTLENRMVANKIAELSESNVVGKTSKGIPLEGLSSADKAALNKQLQSYTAIVPSATGSLSINRLESGYVAAKSSTRFDTNNPATEVNGFFAKAANPANTGLSNTKANTFRSYTSGAQVRDKAAPGVSTSALIIQGTDAAISTKVGSSIPSQNFHDANMFGIKDMVKGSLIQNKAMWDAVTGYDSQLANMEAMIRSYTGISKLSKDANFVASDWRDVSASLRQLALKSGLIKRKNDAFSAGDLLGNIVSGAYNREVAKLETLKGIEWVNQYGYEGGEYQVTAADRKALDTKIADLNKRREAAVKEAQALGKTLADQIKAGTTKESMQAEKVSTAQRKQAIEEAASDSIGATVASTRQNSLERFLSAQPEGKVSAKDLMRFTASTLASGKTDGSAIQKRMQSTYAEISKVLANTLPDNLEVNIISGLNNSLNVKGAEDHINSRAWYYSDKNINQINIRMDGKNAPGLEVVLHEMLHAATAHALDSARKNPKANPALTEVSDRLTDLHGRVKAMVDSNPAYAEFNPAVANVDEMISWGMTNPRFQQFLDSIQNVPLQGRSTRNMLTMFREFAANVLRAVYAFTKRKPTDKQITATEALVLDTADLLQNVDNKAPMATVNAPMVNAANATQRVRQYTHREVFDSLVSNNAGKQNSPEFVNNLSKTISDVSDKLFSQIQGQHLTSQQTVYTPGQVWANALATGQAPYTTKALGAGFRMTDQEAFAIESIETAVNAALNSGFGTAVNREIRKTWEAARTQIKPEAFHSGNWSTATVAEKAAAQAKWDHLFKLESTQTGNNRYMSQFLAMTLGHEETSRMMGFTADTSTSNNTRANNFEKAAGYVAHAMNWASGFLSKTNSGQLLNQKASVLTKQLIEIDLKNRDKSVTALEEIFNSTMNRAEELGTKVLDGVHATADVKAIREAKSPIVRFAGSVTRLAAKRNLDELTNTVRQMRDMNYANTADGWAANLFSDISNPDSVRKGFDSLLRQTSRIEQQRRNLAEITRGNVMEMFQDSGKYLEKADQEALTYSLIRTEAHSLLGRYDLKQVSEMLTDGRKRNAEINRLEQSIGAEQNGNGMIIRAKALGYYMVTGKATIPGLAKNADAISGGAGTKYTRMAVPDMSGNLASDIDSLASLYAMRYTKTEHKQRTAAVMKRELANPENGIKAMLNVHKALSDDAQNTLFTGNQISRIKGYIPEVTNPYRDVKITDEANGIELEKMGYQRVGNVPSDPNIAGSSNVMYATKDNGSQRYVSGATSLTSNKRKGTQALKNSTTTLGEATKSVYDAIEELDRTHHSSFDPTQVTDTYMIPIFTTNGTIKDFQYEMSHENRDTLLDRNNDFAHLLGQYAGQTFDKQHSPEQNRNVIEAMHEDYSSNYAKAPERYVPVGPDVKDARMREIWAMLPERTRMDAEEVWGVGSPMMIRSDLVNLTFGFRKLSIGDTFDNKNNSDAADVISGTLSGILGDQAKYRAVAGERGIQQAMQWFKDVVVIKNVTTLLRNQMGNITLLKAFGVPVRDIAVNTKIAVQAGLSYRKNMTLMLKYQQQQRAGLGDYNALEQRILQLQDQIERNPLKGFIEEGMMPSIVDDVDVSDNNYTYASAIQQKVSKYTDKVPASVRTAAKWAFVTKGTPLYKFLSNATKFSDFSSKYVLYKYAIERRKDALNHTDALQLASDTFVNYDVPTSPELQYLNDTGLMMFTKYRFRIQRTMLRLMKDHPGTTLAQSALIARFTNAPTALEPNMITGVGNPFSSSVMQIPSALDEPFPIKLMQNLF